MVADDRDVVLEASASARGGLEAVFFSWRPRLGLDHTVACLGLALVSIDLTASASIAIGSAS